MEVKRVTENDLVLVSEILTYLGDDIDSQEQSHIKNLLQDDRSYLFAALVDEQVVGYVVAYSFPSLYPAEKLAYLYDIEVFPEYRRKGVGRFLMETVVGHLKADGVTELWLGTAIDNISAQKLFTATGGVSSDETFKDYTFDLTK